MIPTLPNRKNIRLKNYDYSLSGWYYVTICTQNRLELFGKIAGDPGIMKLNDIGKMVDQKIIELKKYQNVEINICSIMPNHVHLVLIINNQKYVGVDPYDNGNDGQQ
jgi:REP element-mobilizing transposase RayT